MATSQSNKPLTSRTVETMKPGDKILADTGENTGLRVKCGASGIKTFSYRYTSPFTQKLIQVKIGNFPDTSLAEARLKLQELKQIRRQGRCPSTEAKEREKEVALAQEQERIEAAQKQFTVKDLRIPDQTGHAFRSKLDTDSTANWTVIPVQTGH